jgi:hypothetical protein
VLRAKRSPSKIRRDRDADRTNVLDDLEGDARRVMANRVLISRQRAQDAMCATIEGLGSICDSRGLARAPRAF